MSNTYRWFIYEMEVIPDFNGLINFVSKIRWRYNATNQSGFTANIEGMTTYNQESEENYIDYYSLTESEVNNWLDQQENLMDLQSKLDNIINEQMFPSVIVLPTPWETN